MKINSGINTINNLKVLSGNLDKTSKKLSTGIRINSASDDAAGLAISEKMRAQIRGLEQAARNSQDGISLLQVSDGAMSEINNILNRVRELSVQAGNDSNSIEDRESIQSEIEQLLSEIDRIANETEFNNIPILNGVFGNEINADKSGIAKYVQYITSTGGVTDKYQYNGKDYASAVIDFSNLTSKDDIEKIVGQGIQYSCCSCTKMYSIKFVKGTPDVSRLNDINPVMEVDITGIANGIELVSKIKETAYGELNYIYNPEANPPSLPLGATSFVNHFSKLASDGGKLYIYDDREYMNSSKWPSATGEGRFEIGVYGEPIPDPDTISILNILVGAEKDQIIKVKLPKVTLHSMDLKNPNISELSNLDANKSIDRIDKAINYVNGERIKVGAYQNRLEHTIKNAQNSALNLQNTESKIRDADVAKEFMNYFKQDILRQSSQAMLAQTKEMNNTILNLSTMWNK